MYGMGSSRIAGSAEKHSESIYPDQRVIEVENRPPRERIRKTYNAIEA